MADIAGIYPVFDFRTYPGLANAAPAYGLTPDELQAKQAKYNPIERVAVLAKAKIPALFIHGDDDKVVPLKENSAEFKARYLAAGAEDAVTLIVAKGFQAFRRNHHTGNELRNVAGDFLVPSAW